jgi:hypothetical protein
MRIGKIHLSINNTCAFVTKEITYSQQITLLQITQSIIYAHHYVKIRAVIKTYHWILMS